MIHPATVLGLWLGFLLALPRLGWLALSLIALALFVPMLIPSAGRAHFVRLLRRSRVLLLALLLVYGVATPGHPLIAVLPWMPSVEGVQGGLIQAARLLLILASLAWVLGGLGQAGLMSGLYAGLKPLARLGVPVQTFVVRLALVLGQQPPAVPLSPAGLARIWDAPLPVHPGEVTVELLPFTWRDGLALAVGLTLLAGSLA